MVYGPVGAFLAEFFPGRIRYTSVSVPYHIGNGWGGGLVPFITSAAFAATGSLAYALLYCITVPAVCFILALFLMPETRKIASGSQRQGGPQRSLTRICAGPLRPRTSCGLGGQGRHFLRTMGGTI